MAVEQVHHPLIVDVRVRLGIAPCGGQIGQSGEVDDRIGPSEVPNTVLLACDVPFKVPDMPIGVEALLACLQEASGRTAVSVTI